jgi:hypothetical protein
MLAIVSASTHAVILIVRQEYSLVT